MSKIDIIYGNTPVAESGYQNVRWQVDNTDPFNPEVSAEVPQASSTLAGILKLIGDLGGGFNSPIVVGLQGFPINPTTPTTGQFLRVISGAWKGGPLLLSDIPDLSSTYQVKSQKNIAGGYAGLDGSGLVPISEIPVSSITIPESQVSGLTSDLSTLAAAISTETSRAEAAEALLAPKASPALTGVPTAPTASPLTSNTQIATTAYVDAAVTAGGGGGGSSTLAGDTDVVISSPANNDVLTYETSSSKWKNKPATGGGGGGGVPAGSNLIPVSPRSATDSGFGGYSIIMRLPQGLLLCFPTSWKFSISLAAGASYVVSKGVVYRTNVDSNVVIDSTTVTWSSSGTPTLGAGETFCDPISLALDTSHDYWIVVHFSSSSGTLNTGSSSWIAAFFHSDCGYISGDETGLMVGNTIPSVTGEASFYRVIST